MSVTIRLAKFGKRHAPTYRVVATNTRSKRNGRFLDLIGHYTPEGAKAEFVFDSKKYDEWVNKGAIVTEAVKKLKEGNYEFKAYKKSSAATADTTDTALKDVEQTEVIEENQD